jgi:hypothetical protein
MPGYLLACNLPACFQAFACALRVPCLFFSSDAIRRCDSHYTSSGQMSLWANVFLADVFLGKCLSGQKSFWANVFWAKVFLGKCPAGQTSFWANVFWTNVFLGKRCMGKCPSEQMSFWANVFWVNVVWANVGSPLGKPACNDGKYCIFN